MPRKKKTETIKESKQETITATEEVKQEEVLGAYSTKEEPTEEIETNEEPVVIEEEVQEFQEELLPDLDTLDLSEFETEPEEQIEPVKTVKQLEQTGLIPFDEFYDMFYKSSFKMLSFVVGYRSVEEFGSKEKMAEVIYRRMANSPTLKKLLYPKSQNLIDLMIVGEAIFDVGGKFRAERQEKIKAKALLKQGATSDEQTQNSNFDQFIAR